VTERIFVDASVFLRFLARDVEGQYAKARALFEQAERGTLRLETTVLALVELTRALEHDWGMTRGETLEVLEAILDTRNLRVPNHAMVREAVELYGRGGMDFPDACTIVWLRSGSRKRVASFRNEILMRREGFEVF
jgi:predicted nucleic-acid-binding protein